MNALTFENKTQNRQSAKNKQRGNDARGQSIETFLKNNSR
jgi:hypothetical protein